MDRIEGNKRSWGRLTPSLTLPFLLFRDTYSWYQETPIGHSAIGVSAPFGFFWVRDLPTTVAQRIASYPPVIHMQSTISPAITEIGGKLGAKRGRYPARLQVHFLLRSVVRPPQRRSLRPVRA